MILKETFIDDVEKLLSYVGFDAGVPWGVVPGGASFAVTLAVSWRCLGGLWVVGCMLICRVEGKLESIECRSSEPEYSEYPEFPE